MAVGLTAAGCGVEPPTDFTADTRSGFMAACSRPLEDPQFVTEICRCVFLGAAGELSFDRFAAVDERLRADPEAELPAEIVDIIADCVIEVAEL